ncbi:MAG: DNA methyltransferase, partial [Terriglobia bacterium]
MRHRLHSICPYFAMFPEKFVEEQVNLYSERRDYVFDPFSGRGTTLFQSLLMGRNAAATDINPVAFCISGAKAETPSLADVLNEIDSLERLCSVTDHEALEVERQHLPAFFRRAFYHSTLRELLFLRGALDWRQSSVHRFTAALVLGSLHGEMDKSDSYFSNQMPRTISMKPRYSLKYWREHNLWPRKREVFKLLRERAALRLSDEMPASHGRIALSDARKASQEFLDLTGKVRLVVTSPPYYDVTNYEEDQWLRLWFLGNEPKPTYQLISKDDRHST